MNKDICEVSIICCYYNEINILKKKFQNFIEEREKFTFSNEIIIAQTLWEQPI